MDLLRLVTFSAGGRPVVRRDLEDPESYWKVRDTLKFTPGKRKSVYSQGSRRYGGARQVSETHENGTVEAQWVVTGADEDGCLANMRGLLSDLEDARPGLFLEFRPDGAGRSTYFELRGTADWNPEYQWVRFAGNKAIALQVSFPTEPTGRLARMDVGDTFDVDSREDYLFDALTEADVSVTGGNLAPAGAAATSERRMIHAARGYPLKCAEVTLEFTPGIALSGFKAGIVHRRISAGTYAEVYVDDNGTNSRLRVDTVVNGTRTNRSSVNLAARIQAGVTAWVRGRFEGNTLVAEHFTSAPTPNGTPTNTTSSSTTVFAGSLAGAGLRGLSWVAQDTFARLASYQDRPYARRLPTLPSVIAWEDDLPGDAPALIDLHITSSDATLPVWAMFGWCERPSTPLAGTVAPFGLIQGESAAALTTFASVANAAYRNGNGVRTTASGLGSGSARWDIDPSTLVPDDFQMADLALEVWARLELASTLVNPRIVLLARPGADAAIGQDRYTEWGALGRSLLPPSSGTQFRFVRLGILPLASNPDMPSKWAIMAQASWEAGSSGLFGIDELLAIPVRGRAAGPTGKTGDTSYPRMFALASTQLTRIVRSDLSGMVGRPPSEMVDSVGHLGGKLLELPPGPVDTVLKLSSLVPDDPVASGSAEKLEYQCSVHLAVTPRVHLFGDG